ncbi:MAG TPA: hypothetical protein PK784_10780 [Tenuifilaceae bacterium]|nr:hypothetical protein [Tenuifilaceae bacterium]
MRPKVCLKVLIPIIMGVGTTSCHMLYVPNSFNSPLLRNKGDGQINVTTGISGFEVQTAYAITDNVGIMANGQVLKTTEHDTLKQQRTLFELGLGYTEKFSDNGIFEIFGGAGVGEVPADYRKIDYDGVSTTQITRYFIQPGLGFYNDWLDISILSRLSAVSIGGETNWFYEPGFMAKMGYKRLRFYSCIGLSIPFEKYDDQKWNHNPIMFSIGIHFNFGKRLEE